MIGPTHKSGCVTVFWAWLFLGLLPVMVLIASFPLGLWWMDHRSREVCGPPGALVINAVEAIGAPNAGK